MHARLTPRHKTRHQHGAVCTPSNYSRPLQQLIRHRPWKVARQIALDAQHKQTAAARPFFF